MKMRTFIRQNRHEIDASIRKALKDPTYKVRNDEERELWVMNNEPLYLQARREGVPSCVP